MMKPALAFSQPEMPKSWQHLPQGEKIKSAIEQELMPWWPKFFGYHLAKIGCLSSVINTAECSIKHQFSIVQQHTLGDITGEIDDLPLLEHSVDVCLLTHTLEFSLDPHHIIREANRVLIPNGYLVISGFNPLSLAGLNKLIPFHRKQIPWQGRFFTPMRIKDWLHLMGYEILADQRCLYTSLTNNGADNIVSRYWQTLAAKFMPNLGSIYVIVAKKRVLPLTPIKPKWRLSPNLTEIKGVPVKGASAKVYPKNKSDINI